MYWATSFRLPLPQTLMLLLPLLPINANHETLVTIADLRNSKRRHSRRRFHTKDISFGGSHIQGVALHASTTDPDDDVDDHWSVTAPLVYALPNCGSKNGLMNHADAFEKIVLFDRGEDIPILMQIHTAQHAGAVAAIIVDYQEKHEKNTALHAAVKAELLLWQSLTIPSVVVNYDQGERLKSR
eukprot:CAMPEP_0183747578 /NCGR_PEP_ID=MMETSP0737-20130205/67336_1 /TAXON_ID=385413 /ORGANISM="Thalassiosira miniscula, Strain CCMP1093" /LENGTH=183 /DNA_ID=CAMNT_0025983291 /DNA_START=507 /DNA_END=1058 /DNA_ORIENTATION=-